jgi:hypothetical protein
MASKANQSMSFPIRRVSTLMRPLRDRAASPGPRKGHSPWRTNNRMEAPSKTDLVSTVDAPFAGRQETASKEEPYRLLGVTAYLSRKVPRHN